MTKKLALIDYMGTTCPGSMEPGQAVAFVKALQADGYYVVLWSGTDLRDIKADVPGLVESMDRSISKCSLGREILEELGYDDIQVSEVVVLDDSCLGGESMARSFNCARERIARWVHAEDWQTLVEGWNDESRP